MASKTITIRNDVYDELVQVKGIDESFSELFERMLRNSRPNLRQFYGAWKLTPSDDKRLQEKLCEHRRLFQESWEERMQRLK